jgi:hypothetical protein
MKILDLNQLEVETFTVSQDSLLLSDTAIVSTDQVPHCDGYTADNC